MTIAYRCYLKKIFRAYVIKWPSLYFFYSSFNKKHEQVRVEAGTQVVIEGAGGCANTFAVNAFRFAQSEPLQIAHHLHVPAQVIRAAKWNIPVLVLVREPIEAMVSILSRGHIDSHPCAIQSFLVNYAVFYEAILPYRSAYVVCTFEQLVSNYGEAIERLNARFGTNFSPYLHTEDNESVIFSQISLGKPNTQRTLNKETARNKVLDQVLYLKRAQRAYKNFMDKV